MSAEFSNFAESESADIFPLMELPDELLVMIYKNLDAKSLANVMETCKRNYQIIDSIIPPEIHLNDSILKRNFGDLIISERNFANLSLESNSDFKSQEQCEELLMEPGPSVQCLKAEEKQKSPNLFFQFFLKHGSAVRYLTKRLKCAYGLRLLKFTPSLKTLSLVYDELGSVSDALKCHDLPNLTELSIEGKPCLRNSKASISLRYLMDLKLTKLVLDRVDIEKMGANGGFENCKLNIKTLIVTSFDPYINFESFIEFVKLQTQLKTFHFSFWWDYGLITLNHKELYKDLVKFVLNLPSLKSLSLPFPRNLKFRANPFLETLEIHNEIESKELAKVTENFPNIIELSLKLNPPFDVPCLLVNELKCIRTLHIKLTLRNYTNLPIFGLPNLVNFKLEASDDIAELQSKSLAEFLRNHKSLETVELCKIKIICDLIGLRDLEHELRNLRRLTYNETVYEGNFNSTIIVELEQQLESSPIDRTTGANRENFEMNLV